MKLEASRFLFFFQTGSFQSHHSLKRFHLKKSGKVVPKKNPKNTHFSHPTFHGLS